MDGEAGVDTFWDTDAPAEAEREFLTDNLLV